MGQRLETAVAATYHVPGDVPAALQLALQHGYDSGLSVENLATVYELPLDWITLFVIPPQGHA